MNRGNTAAPWLENDIMVRPLTLAAALVLAAVPALAQSARPPQAEEGRGTGQRAEMLQRFDANKDGALDAAEFKAMRAQRFTMMDADKDGRIAKAEFPDAMLRADAERRQAAMARMFDGLDADKDGILTQAEFEARTEAMFDRRDRNDDGKLDGEDRPRRGRD